MAGYTISGVRFAGCALVLGENRHVIDDEPEFWNRDPEQLHKLKTMIGMDVRYVANDSTTTCDMCDQAAASLFGALDIAPADIGAVISVTQTPDHAMPGNAHVLHHRLGFSHDVPALDVTMGCSGFVYGLWLAAMAASCGGKKVLLVAGDTLSKKAGKQDRTTMPLFGDAGAAAVISPDPANAGMRFVLHADGSHCKDMYIPAGGAREPSTEATRAAVVFDDDGSSRSAEDVFMDGFAVFRFTMTEQPKLLREILAYSGKSADDMDYFILHQANRYIVETIVKKAGIPPEKSPADIFSRFGNQNSASIPGVLCGALAEALRGVKAQAVLQGYGTGLSWGACQLVLDNVVCLPPVRYGRTESEPVHAGDGP